MIDPRTRLAAVGALALACSAGSPAPPVAEAPPLQVAVRPGEPIRPLPAATEGDPARVALGRDLFVEPRLSRDRSVRCIDCHPFDRGGADPRPRSLGAFDRVGVVQAPSVFNLAFADCLNWDGRTCDLDEHALLPLYNERVMAHDEASLIAALADDADYVARFAAAYPDGLTARNIADALAAYERTLVTPDAPVDRWLRGEDDALGREALAGYRLFKAVGCASCHQGTNVGGNLFQPFGVIAAAPEADGEPYTGRDRVTGRAEDRGVFRVPSLRNVAATAPYFHDGSAATLAEAVQTMARVQLGESLAPAEVAALVTFLAALTGRQPRAPRG